MHPTSDARRLLALFASQPPRLSDRLWIGPPDAAQRHSQHIPQKAQQCQCTQAPKRQHRRKPAADACPEGQRQAAQNERRGDSHDAQAVDLAPRQGDWLGAGFFVLGVAAGAVSWWFGVAALVVGGILGIVFAAVLGIGAGLYPSIRASRMQVVDAMRYE